jgi:hypothetical protein
MQDVSDLKRVIGDRIAAHRAEPLVEVGPELLGFSLCDLLLKA